MRESSRSVPDGKPEWRILDRFLAGEATAAEAAEVGAWAAADPRREAWLHELRRIRPVAVDVDEGWSRLAGRIAPPTDPARGGGATTVPLRRPPDRRRVSPVLLRLAAAIALVVLGVRAWDATRQPRPYEVATAAAAREEVLLPDGSVAVLGPQSRLRFATGDAERRTELTGEALFRVNPDAARPFRVRAGDAVVEVLGTEFSVRAYPDDVSVRVLVAEGRVAFQPVDRPDQRLILGGGEVARLEANGTLTRSSGVDLEPLLAWTEGRLTFDGTPLAEVIIELERWYGTDLALGDDQLGRRRITASFAGESLAEVLQVIDLSLGTRTVRRGDTLVLVPRE